jgi:hypothetical protein
VREGQRFTVVRSRRITIKVTSEMAKSTGIMVYQANMNPIKSPIFWFVEIKKKTK